MATRIAPPVWESMRAIDPRLRYEPLARIALLESPFPEQCRQQERVPGTLAIVSAGTADTAVAEVSPRVRGWEARRERKRRSDGHRGITGGGDDTTSDQAGGVGTLT